MEENEQSGIKELIAESTEESEEKPAEPEKPEEEEKPEEPESTPYTGKFKNIKTVEQLEESYGKSFAEANRLLKEIEERDAKIAALEIPDDNQENPKIEEIKRDVEVLKAHKQAEDKKGYEQFIAEHPEIMGETDEVKALQNELAEALTFVGNQALKKKEGLGMYEGLKRAWKYVKPDDGEAELKGAEKAVGAELAATSAPGSTPAPEKKQGKQLTEDQKRVAKTYGMTPEQYLEYMKQ